MTLEELRKRLLDECFVPERYAVGPEWKDRFEVLAVDKIGATWQVFYAERGERSVLLDTADEGEACARFYQELGRSRGARTHLVGTYGTRADAEALAARLRTAGVTPIIDEHLLRSPDTKEYRVFVEGCHVRVARGVVDTQP
jgi:hypothetical protein